ncbi:callose synthase 3 isoform X3 [Selaginella moellendorffii]|uniref:callose synthase 3 isoform X3 n=1 Tax=Selaginella moellendorffii TaxID=88036 RepID=UPI000D1CD064|nr:callose synthase 3 isoform X3 [Selaginella moellendorffii]|eukprot:XP_024540407.1 callose synthase 3 isoform X3 [Selaginella moellendorffii]
MTTRLPRTFTTGTFPTEFDSEVVPSSLGPIAAILRVANEVEQDSQRVAYLCRFYAFERAHYDDPSSSGRGVRQFKTALLQRLEKDEEPSRLARRERSDAREMQRFYQNYYDKYVKALEADHQDRASLAKAYQTAGILFDVLTSVTRQDGAEVDSEMQAMNTDVTKKKKDIKHYNILPLDAAGASQAIMKLEEVRAAHDAIANVRGLPKRKEAPSDILEWLQVMFGFQKDNVANQREHLILLLANVHVSLDPEPSPLYKLDQRATEIVMKRMFKNYRTWCKFLGRSDKLELPEIQLEVQQRMILYMALYLLIWGEAANVRFMPECLCYIFHHMASELSGMLSGRVSYVTGENIKPAYGSEDEAFLKKVVTPIYNVIFKEKESNRNESGGKPHSSWRNYDDLNEYFWSKTCFRLGWPMRKDDEFFVGAAEEAHSRSSKLARFLPRKPSCLKTNFVEARSFWHLFRTFDRMWTFFILWLQAMIIIAWNGSGSLGALFEGSVFKKVLSVFITAAVLRFFQALLDIIFSFKALHSLGYVGSIRLVLKVLVSAFWIVILSTSYVHSWEHPTGLTRTIKNLLGHNGGPSVYLVAVILYLVPNAIAAIFFLLPCVRRVAEESDAIPVRILLWWSQPPCYIGRGMHEEPLHLFSYTFFWIVLITCKLLFSYYVEIKPLVEPTKFILDFTNVRFAWHEFFPHARGNIGVLIALWTPVILVYFMDIQIWYSIMSTIWGGVVGAFMRLGEIRTLSMLRSRFRALPTTFNWNLIPLESSVKRKYQILRKFKAFEHNKLEEARFAHLWNAVIESLREEDFLDDKEKELMLLPYSADPYPSNNIIQWPPFLLASMAPMAIEMAKEYAEVQGENVEDARLWNKIKENEYMRCAVEECYEFLKNILLRVVTGDTEKRLIHDLLKELEDRKAEGKLLENFRMNDLPLLAGHFVRFLEFLDKPDPSDTARDKVVLLLQDMLEVFMHDMMVDDTREKFESSHGLNMKPTDNQSVMGGKGKIQFFAGKDSILYPLPEDHAWSEQIKRVLLLLTETESAMDVPKNLDARRRITFFTNSLFMKMPPAPRVRKMIPFSVLTPFYEEEVLYSKNVIEEPNEDGVSILFYLQNVYPDEWNKFLERVNCSTEEEVEEAALRDWTSYRGQTLSRTVRGMMYYRTALELQAFLDLAPDEDVYTGFKEVSKRRKEEKGQDSFWAKLDAIVDMKFTFVATCQKFGQQKHSKDLKEASKAQDIQKLMTKYPSLRVAYVLEEEPSKGKPQKSYYSVLSKAVDGRDEEIYKIRLPGPVNIGEGKPENQNHAIIFTRGLGLQTIDMNQENYLEEAFKVRNLLEEFKSRHGARFPTILGVREHIFTGSVSSLAWFMSNQETSFVTIGQRVLATPLKVRFHYGHPDVFDRIFHITRGGVSKASKGINLSEDIFAGFNSTLRRGLVTHHEYIQVGKGRDVGLNQISIFEAKVANGNGEQTLSRDVYRLGHRFDFFRMLSFYITTVGYYFSTMIVILTVYVFLYGRLYLALSGLERSFVRAAQQNTDSALQSALASQSLIQLGLLMALPMVMEIGLERGFRMALSDLIVMQLQLASVFFTFTLGSKVHYYGRTIFHGGAKYRATGRGFVVRHEKFPDNYRLYSRSHFVKGFELMILLIIYDVYGSQTRNAVSYVLITFSMWFLVGTWLFSPFLFNPSGFEWQKIVEDWNDWNKWISSKGRIGVPANKSWESWWEEEQDHLQNTGFRGRVFEVILALRFVLYQYGIVYQLNIMRGNKSLSMYGLSWVVICVVLFTLKVRTGFDFTFLIGLCLQAVSLGRKKFKANFQLVFRMLKGVIFVAVLSVIAVLFRFAHLTVGDLFASILAFVPTGWGLLQIFQACRPVIVTYGMWDSVQALARTYEYVMGLLLFAPVAILAWFPFVSEFQTRLLFNQAFSRGLQISRILAGKRKKVADD